MSAERRDDARLDHPDVVHRFQDLHPLAVDVQIASLEASSDPHLDGPARPGWRI
jgi:hypothetical protein